MSHRDQLIAYIATLLALVVVFVAALIAGALNGGVLGKIELFGLGTITGGLIGALRTPSARAPMANVENAENVTQGGELPGPPPTGGSGGMGGKAGRFE